MTDITREVWRALLRADLLSVPELYIQCCGAVQKRASFEREFLIEKIGESTWGLLLDAWGREDGDAAATTQLGLGALLTEYLAAPVMCGKQCVPVAHLGTLANLIVGIYDDIVDAGADSDPLPKETLEALFLGGGARMPHTDPLTALVHEYFRQLAVIAAAGADPEILRTLRRAIVKMYTAERGTLAGGTCEDVVSWRRKSALPFVVMGLPSWLAASNLDPQAYRRHLRWLWRCGEFWGWIDDVVDLHEDTAASHTNRVQEALRQETPSALAARIANNGRTVAADWRIITPRTQDLPLAVQEAIPTCLFSAFGYALQHV